MPGIAGGGQQRGRVGVLLGGAADQDWQDREPFAGPGIHPGFAAPLDFALDGLGGSALSSTTTLVSWPDSSTPSSVTRSRTSSGPIRFIGGQWPADPPPQCTCSRQSFGLASSRRLRDPLTPVPVLIRRGHCGFGD
jgi:hypothetical protein